MTRHLDLSNAELHQQIRKGLIRYGGNIKLKIYGLLNCGSGKRMNRKNRVFFPSDEDAIDKGFRPCGNCMKTDYLKWKDGYL